MKRDVHGAKGKKGPSEFSIYTYLCRYLRFKKRLVLSTGFIAEAKCRLCKMFILNQ